MLMRLNPHHPIRRTAFGQSLSEYSLVIGLVAITGIAGVALLSQNVQNGLSASIGGNTSGGPQTALTNSNTNPGGSGSNMPQNTAPVFFPDGRWSSTELLAGATQTPITLPNGKTLNVVTPDFATLAETTGPNGQVNAALASLDKFVSDLKEAGVSQDVIEELVSLSRTGHSIADRLENQDQYTSENIGKLQPDYARGEQLDMANQYASSAGLPTAAEFEKVKITKNANEALIQVNNLPYRKPDDTKFLSELHPSEQLFVKRKLADEKLDALGLSALKPTIAQLTESIRNADSNSSTLVNIVMNGRVPSQYQPLPWMTARSSSNGICNASGSGACQVATRK